MKRLGIPHRVVLDSIFEAPFEAAPAHDFRDKIVVTDWHVARAGDVGAALQNLLKKMGAEAIFYPLESPERAHDWRHALADFKQARLVVTGRHHGLCLAALAGVPFVALGSNTWKIEGMLELLPGGLPVCSDPAQLQDRCRAALADRAVFSRVQEFVRTQLPLATFEKLAQIKTQDLRPVLSLNNALSPEATASLAASARARADPKT